MAQEIERKFLVKGDFKSMAFKTIHIAQGYLCSNPERTVRVRVKGDKGFITIKGKSDKSGTTRFEWEKEISLEESESLLRLAEHGIVEKERYLVENTDGKHTWEIDVFHGDNKGLVVAEIELASENEPFDKPEWLGREVTGDPRYFNSMLLKKPYKDWEQ